MASINREWHESNRMPKNPTDDQRIQWHIEHAKNCSCRPIPQGVIKLMQEKGIEMPKECKSN